MTFFYDLNKKLAGIADKPQTKTLTESAQPAVAEGSTGDYSAKKARAGKDIGKPGKQFAQIAKSAGERYGSKERGEKVAGAVLAKLRGKNEGVEEGLGDVAKKLGSGIKKVAQRAMDTVAPGDEALLKDLQKKVGVPQTGKKPGSELNPKVVKEVNAPIDFDKVLDAIAALYGDEIWDNDAMQDLANDLEQAGPTDRELDFIIAKGKLPKRLAGIQFSAGDNVQFGEGSSPMSPKQKSFAALAEPKDKITFADKIAGAKKEGDMDESALQAYLGKKKYGEKGMKALQQAGRDGASKAKMDRIRDQHDQMDEGWDDMLKAVDQQRSKMKTGEKIKGHKGEIEKTATGIKHTRSYDAKTGETDTGDDAPAQGEKRGRGRPKGTGKSMGAKGPSGKSKLMTREGEQDPAEKGEYDREGDMALDDIDTIESAANELQAIIDTDENLPEWVQSKINKAMDYLDTARDYMKAQGNDQEPVTEKAVSKKQQRFMGMVHATQKGEKAPSKEVAKVAKTMKKGDAEDFAKTKHKGLPEKKKKEETDESTTAGSVATAPTSGKSKGGFSFGKGIYDSYNREVEAMIAESINISMNANSDGGEMGGGTRSLTVTATDEDAMKLAALLKMAGLGGQDHGQMDEAYGDTQATENHPDYPTNQETAQDNFEYSGGLNKPKASGMSVTPVTSVQMDGEDKFSLPAQMNEADSDDSDLTRMREMAGIREAKKPDFPDLDKDGNKQEPIEKAAKDAKDKKVEESILAMTNLWKTYRG
jgi:hypothetical protein